MSQSECEWRGLVTARSLRANLGCDCTLLKLQTKCHGVKRIVASGIPVSENVTCGKYYMFNKLTPRKNDADSSATLLILSRHSLIKEVEFDPELDPMPANKIFVLKGKVTAVDEKLAIYEIDSTKLLFVTFLRVHCQHPKLQVGDEIEVENVHRVDGADGEEYYVMCLRSCIFSRTATEIEGPGGHSIFVGGIEKFGFGIRTVLWIREALPALKTCISEAFLQSQGAPNTDLVYMDILLKMWNSKNSECAVESTIPERDVIGEFFDEDHVCPLSRTEPQPPLLPISVTEFLKRQANTVRSPGENDTAGSWRCHIGKAETDERPLLAYFDISKKQKRFCLKDAGEREATVLPIQRKDEKRSFASVRGKLVLVSNPHIIVETFVEDNEDDPQSAGLGVVTEEFMYLPLAVTDLDIMGPQSGASFAQWQKTTIFSYLEEKGLRPPQAKQAKTTNDTDTLIPLQENSQKITSYMLEKFMVLHKTALQASANGSDVHGWILVKAVSPERFFVNGKETRSNDFFMGVDIFLRVVCPLANLYEMIPALGEIEVRIPPAKASAMKLHRSTVPFTHSIRSKLKTNKSMTLPEGSEMYVQPRASGDCDIYSVREVMENSALQDEIFSVKGKIVGRLHEKPRFEREKIMFDRREHFGVPGSKRVIIVDIADNGETVRVYVSWPNQSQYPLGLVPGALVVIKYVSRTSAKFNSVVYLRTTSLSAVDVLEVDDPTQVPPATEKIPPITFDLSKIVHHIQQVRPAWCLLSNLFLSKLEMTAVCNQCEQSYERGVCTFAGCFSPLGPRIKGSARVIVQTCGLIDSIFIDGDNLPVLIGVNSIVWRSLVQLASSVGTIRYNGRKEEGGERTSTKTKVFGIFCGWTVTHKHYHAYCRRFKNSSEGSASSLYCIKLLAAKDSNSLNMVRTDDGGAVATA